MEMKTFFTHLFLHRTFYNNYFHVKNDENYSIFDLSVVPLFLKFEKNQFIQRETNLTPVDANH